MQKREEATKGNEKDESRCKEKALVDVPQFSEYGLDKQFRYLVKASSPSHHKMVSMNKKAEMKEKEAHAIQKHVPQQAYHQNNVTSVYHSHAVYASRMAVYHSHIRYQKT